MAQGCLDGSAMSEIGCRNVEFFGGAIVCDLPHSLTDASQVRHVPDHQEVWVDSMTDSSLVCEILQKAGVKDSEAVKFFLADLADSNDARSSAVVQSRRLGAEEVPYLPAEVACFSGLGEQMIAKFKEVSANKVEIHLCVIRLAEQETDIVVSFNSPSAIDPESSSAGATLTVAPASVFEQIIKSLRIVDWNLFDA
uniref:Ran guanine nucleotide release factor n=1 Tax=Noctiluca scintillans TaxID=2966 RepID=A0A7S1APN3_NOCSC